MLLAPAIALAIFAMILVYLGWSHGDSSTPEGFNMADRSANWARVAFGAFTVVGAGEFVGMTAYTYDIGLSAFFLALGFSLGAIILAATSKNVYELSRELKFDSLPDVIAHRFGRFSSLIITTISILALGSLLLIQFSLGGVIISQFLKIDLHWAVAAIAVVVIAYVWLGGMKAILFTDMVQGTAMLIFLSTIVASLAFTSDSFLRNIEEFGFISLVSEGSTANLSFTFILLFSGATAISGGIDLWQRLFVGKSYVESRRGLFFSAFLFAIFGLLLTLLAIQIISVVAPENAGTAFEEYFTIHLPRFWLAMAVVGLFAGIISTADAELLVISIATSRELKRFGLNESIESKDTRWISLILGIFFAIGGYLATGKLDAVFSILLFLLMITGVAGWVILFNRGSKTIFLPTLIVSVGIFAMLWFNGLLFVELWSLLIPAPLFVNFLYRGE